MFFRRSFSRDCKRYTRGHACICIVRAYASQLVSATCITVCVGKKKQHRHLNAALERWVTCSCFVHPSRGYGDDRRTCAVHNCFVFLLKKERDAQTRGTVFETRRTASGKVHFSPMTYLHPRERSQSARVQQNIGCSMELYAQSASYLTSSSFPDTVPKA